MTNRILWECENVAASVCIDSEEDYPVEIGVLKTDYMVWDFQAYKAEKDDFAFMSGWCNSYNHEKFRQEELDEYINDAFLKITPYINKESRVLEVGIGSGMIANPLISLCKQYDGCDFSKEVLDVLKKRVTDLGYENVNLYELSAHEICRIPEKYDCILMNSVTEYFSGYNYMREVVKQCINQIDGKGEVFLLDIFDLDRLEDYKASVAEYAKLHPKAKYKRDFLHELYFPRYYWESLKGSLNGIKEIEVSDKIGVIDNEINRYRYDVRISVDKGILADETIYLKSQYGVGNNKNKLKKDIN